MYMHFRIPSLRKPFYDIEILTICNVLCIIDCANRLLALLPLPRNAAVWPLPDHCSAFHHYGMAIATGDMGPRSERCDIHRYGGCERHNPQVRMGPDEQEAQDECPVDDV